MARQDWGITEIPTRHAPFGGATGDWDIDVLGVNWTGAAFLLAAGPAEGSASVFTLSTAAAGSEGVSATYDAAVVDPKSGQVVGATTIRPQINESTLEALTWAPTPTNQPLVLFWELLVTPPGEPQRQLCMGTLKIYPGVGD